MRLRGQQMSIRRVLGCCLVLLLSAVNVGAAGSELADAVMMGARTGKPDAIEVLLENGAKVNTTESWGGTTALMWAVSENHPDAVKILIDRGADLNVRSKVVPADAANSRGPSVTPPRDPAP